MNHDEINENNWKDKRNEWLPYVKNDVLCTAVSNAGYNKTLEEITGIGRKYCLSLPGLRWKHFISLRTEKDEPINTYNDTKDISSDKVQKEVEFLLSVSIINHKFVTIFY